MGAGGRFLCALTTPVPDEEGDGCGEQDEDADDGACDSTSTYATAARGRGRARGDARDGGAGIADSVSLCRSGRVESDKEERKKGYLDVMMHSSVIPQLQLGTVEGQSMHSLGKRRRLRELVERRWIMLGLGWERVKECGEGWKS